MQAAAKWTKHAEAHAKETLVKIAVAKLRQERQEWFNRTLCCGLVWPTYVPSEEERAKAELVRRSTSHVPVDLPFVPEGSGPELRLLVRGSEQASAATRGR